MRGVPMPCGRRTANGDMYMCTENIVTEQNCDDMVLAMAYVPVQQFNTLFEIEEGFARGTIYPELDKPFMGGGCSCGV
ncbi:MAG: spore coat associated protein CotJA [Clostridia bacterium]|nr:spore coat associated protein CotJA [Clostridia bacterium]